MGDYDSVRTAAPEGFRVLSIRLPDGTYMESEHGRLKREAEKARLAARTPAQVAADKRAARKEAAEQRKRWDHLCAVAAAHYGRPIR